MATLEQIQSRYSHLTIFVADIAKLFIQPYQIALDIAAQIDAETVESIKNIINHPLVTKQYDYPTDYWVDIETLGNITVIKTKEIVHLLSSKMPCDSLLVVNMCQQELDADNAVFLEYLGHHIPELIIFLNDSECTVMPIESSFSHPDEISQYAWTCVHVGAIALAINTLKHFYQQEKNITYLVHLQYIRVVTGYFHDVVHESYDGVIGPEALMTKLYYVKAYCGVLTNQIAIAQTYFDKMRMHADMPLKDLQSLYQMNIFALFQFKLGNTEKAFNLEHKIESVLNSGEQVHTQIRYINSLNLARLYRANGVIDKAKYYFDSAYQSISGLMAEGDHVYMNVNYASLYEKSGDLQSAFCCWLRAALHWMGMRYQEALGWRISKAILKKDIIAGKSLDLDEVSDVMNKNLRRLADALHISFPEKSHNFNIIQLKYFNGELNAAQYVGKDNQVGLIASCNLELETWHYHESKSLKQFVLGYLSYVLCLPADCNTLVIDTDHDTKMPVLFHDALKRCICLNIPVLNWNDKILKVNQGELFDKLRIKSSPSQQGIKFENGQYYSVYRRYHQDKAISPDVYALLNNLNAPDFSGILAKYSVQSLYALENEKIIYFDFDPCMTQNEVI